MTELPKIPTLMYTTLERTQIAVLAIVGGKTVVDGFGYALK